MTLKEAHEIQRRELISLRVKVARFKKQSSGLFPNEEKESMEQRIRHLEQIIKTKDSRYEAARSHRKLADNRRYDLELEILELKELISSLQKEIASLRHRAETAENEVRMLNGTNKKLEKRLNTNFENSSLPSSALPFRKKVPNSRKPTGRKPGAQPGHKPCSPSRLLATKEPVHLPVPDELLNNPDIYPTGTRHHAPFPSGIVNDVTYGASVKALAFLLNNYCNVSIAKTKQCISDVTKGIINLSTGTICNLSSQFSAATETDRARIFSLLTHSDVLYSDATVSNINGNRKAVILCTDKKQVLYQHMEHKGHDGLSQIPVNNFCGTLVLSYMTMTVLITPMGPPIRNALPMCSVILSVQWKMSLISHGINKCIPSCRK